MQWDTSSGFSNHTLCACGVTSCISPQALAFHPSLSYNVCMLCMALYLVDPSLVGLTFCLDLKHVLSLQTSLVITRWTWLPSPDLLSSSHLGSVELYLHNSFFLSFIFLARFNSSSAWAFSASSLHDQTGTFAEQPAHAAPWHTATFQVWSRLLKDLPAWVSAASLCNPFLCFTALTAKTFLFTSRKRLAPSSLTPFQ